ncbi:Beta-Casp domain-containing protein [Nitrosospira multiformis]|uniref:Beta-Casp domain-containing protein n=1 Tax=Nitrosospira multiformis TaxID=1231 RepID=A0A1I0CAJ9_9PROT|nr:Beta-Casp domain-containing protein [Nitrosospira multiformis]
MLASLAFISFRAAWNRCASIIYERELLSSLHLCKRDVRGGRIKYHLKYNLDRPECSILITGFQAVGTVGRSSVEGVDQ